jgi:microcin C transport system ATP-binding protein
MTTTATAPLLQVEDLRVAFGAKTVVEGVSFSIAPGEKLALVGESGSGKTVTALALLQLLHDARVQGRALLDDGREPRDLLALPERQMRALRGDQIAMIFQEPMTALNPLMTVGEQIAEVLRLKRAMTTAQSAQAAIELLAKTGIPEPARRAGAYPHQLSGGQRQRAMIAMALACAPKLLLADEPTTALDVSLRGQILDLLEELRREAGMAVLLITHDLSSCAALPTVWRSCSTAAWWSRAPPGSCSTRRGTLTRKSSWPAVPSACSTSMSRPRRATRRHWRRRACA